MGTYCTSTTLDVKMVGTDFSNTSTAALIPLCIDDAEREINKHISNVYDIANFNTSTSIPPMVRTLCEQLSMGYAYENLARGGKDAYMRSDRLIKRAVENLKDIRDGNAQLFDTSGALIPERDDSDQEVLDNTSDYHTTFNEDNELNWKSDEDKISDISDERL